MPRLGLGLRLSKAQMLQSFAQLVKSAGGVLYLDARKADGSGSLTGNDSLWKDLSGFGNDCTLYNQEGTVTSGWQGPPYVNRMDGIDDFGGFLDNPSLDITTAPLAIGVTFKKPVDGFAFLCAKNAVNSADVQYGIFHQPGRDISFFKNDGNFANFAIDSANHVNVVFYWDGSNVTSYENGVQKNQTALVGTLTSTGSLFLGKQFGGNFFSGDDGTFTIYTGSDITKILKAEAKISAEYLALNP